MGCFFFFILSRLSVLARALFVLEVILALAFLSQLKLLPALPIVTRLYAHLYLARPSPLHLLTRLGLLGRVEAYLRTNLLPCIDCATALIPVIKGQLEVLHAICWEEGRGRLVLEELSCAFVFFKKRALYLLSGERIGVLDHRDHDIFIAFTAHLRTRRAIIFNRLITLIIWLMSLRYPTNEYVLSSACKYDRLIYHVLDANDARTYVVKLTTVIKVSFWQCTPQRLPRGWFL